MCRRNGRTTSTQPLRSTRPISSAPGERRGGRGGREIFIRFGHFLVDRQRVWIRPLPRGVLQFLHLSLAVLIASGFILGIFSAYLGVQDACRMANCEKGYHQVFISKDGILPVLGYTTSLPIYHGMEVTLPFSTAYANRHVKEIIQPSLRSRRGPSHSRNTPLLQRANARRSALQISRRKPRYGLHIAGDSRRTTTLTEAILSQGTYGNGCQALQRILNTVQRQQGSELHAYLILQGQRKCPSHQDPNSPYLHIARAAISPPAVGPPPLTSGLPLFRGKSILLSNHIAFS
jgi:hypothetical protein